MTLKPPAEFMDEIVSRFPEDREIMATVLAPAVPVRDEGEEPPESALEFADVAAPGVDEALLRRYAEVLLGEQADAPQLA